ncbi:MAG TPA: hypothetical protein VFT56_01090 [Sphingomonas sp.]|nr:hypothetical protein [Sphingomonas sp.]
MVFGAWLLGQRQRPNWIGSLAAQAMRDPGFPREGSPEDVRAYLSRQEAWDGDLFEALDDAEAEWRRISQGAPTPRRHPPRPEARRRPGARDPRAALAELIETDRSSYAALSRLIGRGPGYLRRFVADGTPSALAPNDRRLLAAYFGVDDGVLGTGAD